MQRVASAGGACKIYIAAPFTIVANGDQQSPPFQATPGQAGPWVGVVVPLLHARVDRVTVHDSGTLQIDVENLSLIVQPSGVYEPWDLQGPAGRRWVGLPSGGVADLTPGRDDSGRDGVAAEARQERRPSLFSRWRAR